MITRKARTKSKLKERIICKSCFTVFINHSNKISTTCPNCGKVIDARIRVKYTKPYGEKHPERAIQMKE